MKGNHPVITLLGNNSGRNMGDAAILASIMDTISRQMPDAEFLVPTINTEFVESNYGDKYNVKAVNVMPWTGSIRLFGIPTMKCLKRSDFALICDGIIFDYKLFGIHNFLITLFFLLPFTRLFKCPFVCFSCGVGPLNTFFGRLFARKVINGSELVTMRDRDSETLCREVGVTVPIGVTGDAAFLNVVSSEERAVEIAKKEDIDLSKPLLGVNVTSYIDNWLTADERIKDKSQYLDMLASAINSAKNEIDTPFQPVLFSTHPMDEEVSNKLASMIDGRVIDNSKYLSHDHQALMRKCELLIGMRFHSLVCSSAVGVPIVGLVYAPKVRGFLRLINCPEFGLELQELSAESLCEKLVDAWTNREDLKRRQTPVISELKAGAETTAGSLREHFFGRTGATTTPRSCAA